MNPSKSKSKPLCPTERGFFSVYMLLQGLEALKKAEGRRRKAEGSVLLWDSNPS
jgi:hypothetical protein